MNPTTDTYRILDPSEVIQSGDEVDLTPYGCTQWIRAGLVGQKAGTGRYRRRVSAAEPENSKVRVAYEHVRRDLTAALDKLAEVKRQTDILRHEAADTIEALQRELGDVRAANQRLRAEITQALATPL